MNSELPVITSPSESTTANGVEPRAVIPGLRSFARYAVALLLCFCIPLYGLVRYALNSDLYSHILLIPFITAYLVWLSRTSLTNRKSQIANRKSELPKATLPFLAGLALIGSYWILPSRGLKLGLEDGLALTTLSFLCFLVAGGLFFCGSRFVNAVIFPVSMLLFMVPFPIMVRNGIEMFFQHSSADAASILFRLSGTPVFRDGLIFHLPGMTIRVAEECSGIRSSLVLFITGLLAAYLFLRTPWKRAALALIVIPLGILRNGFRIFTIGMLCVHVDPAMIDSPLHHRGGPIFFLLSLVPFFLFLIWLRRSDHRSERCEPAVSPLANRQPNR